MPESPQQADSLHSADEYVSLMDVEITTPVELVSIDLTPEERLRKQMKTSQSMR